MLGVGAGVGENEAVLGEGGDVQGACGASLLAARRRGCGKNVCNTWLIGVFYVFV